MCSVEAMSGYMVLEQLPLCGDSGSREKCSGMMEQAHCDSHPDYPSKQDPNVEARIFLKELLVPSAHSSETAASLVVLRSAKRVC